MISDTFTFDSVRAIAQGFSDYVSHKYIRTADKPDIVVGYDRRFLSKDFALTFAAVAKANGLKVAISNSPLTTPVISHLTYKRNALGVMITASHNKYMYNGIKIKEGGKSATPQTTAEIENYISKASVVGENKNIREIDFTRAYISYVKSKFNIPKIFSALKQPVVVDYMYGAAAELAENVFFSKKIIPIHTSFDPLFGFVPPEPIEKNLARLSRAVVENKAAFGLALDGDGDRMAIVDERGRYLSPHQLAPMLFEYLIQNKKVKGKLVQAVSMGYLTKRIAAEHSMMVEDVPVGFKYIAEKMVSEEIAFGVEESGGYSWKGNIPERDGILTGLLVAEMASNLKKKISEIYASIEKKYGKSFFIRKDQHLPKGISNKHSFAVKCRKKMPKVINSKKVRETKTIDGLKVVLEDDSWLLIRPSGTEPLLRVYAEAPSKVSSLGLIDTACKAALSVVR